MYYDTTFEQVNDLMVDVNKLENALQLVLNTDKPSPSLVNELLFSQQQKLEKMQQLITNALINNQKRAADILKGGEENVVIMFTKL